MVSEWHECLLLQEIRRCPTSHLLDALPFGSYHSRNVPVTMSPAMITRVWNNDQIISPQAFHPTGPSRTTEELQGLAGTLFGPWAWLAKLTQRK